MTRYAVPSLIVAVVVLGLVGISVLLGLNLLPNQAESVERGVYAPWLIVWAIIALIVGCGLILAVTLVSFGLKGLSAQTSGAR